ncbi:MAG: Entericidin EcnAB [Gammaproteobacteria bacterium]|nr:Entericidin EcnAB [Gammaproteobacteria bacterium]
MLNKLIIILFTFSLFACAGTLEGVGEDIEKMGKSIKESMKSDKKEDSK